MTQSFRKLLTVKVALYFVILYIVYATKLTNLEERIITWHKTRLSAFPIRVFKISAEKVQKHERTIINAYRIKFELFGVWGHLQAMLTRFLAFFDHLLPYLCWHFLPYNCWQKVNIFGLPTHLFLSMSSYGYLRFKGNGKMQKKSLVLRKVGWTPCLFSS